MVLRNLFMEEDYTSFALKALAFVGPQQRCSPPHSTLDQN
jgi:hypothetical protein